MSTQNYREIAAISAMSAQGRDNSVLIFFNGVLVPKDWKVIAAVSGDEGYVVRYVTEDGYILRAMEPSGYLVPATVVQYGRVSVRVPMDYFQEGYGQFGGRFPRIKPHGVIMDGALTGCITSDKIARNIVKQEPCGCHILSSRKDGAIRCNKCDRLFVIDFDDNYVPADRNWTILNDWDLK